MRRRIHRAAGATSNQVADALQSVLAAELLFPSNCIWLISPWVSDTSVINNSSGGFVALEPSWGYRGVRLSEVLGQIASLGCHIVLATRPDSLNDHFIASLTGRVQSLGVPERISIHRKDEDDLHEKGMLTDRFYLAGSMNFTYKGIQVNEEVLTLSSDAEELAMVRLTYHRRWGGLL